MDDIQLDFGDEPSKNQSLPAINSTSGRIQKEKANNLFSAMSAAIEQEKKDGSSISKIAKQWENGPLSRNRKGIADNNDKQESSDSFDMDVDPNISGVKLVNKATPQVQNDDSDDEFGIIDNTTKHNFK